MSDRLPVRKMFKLFIDGAFVRSESARSEPSAGANVARASRKDARDAVVAARTAVTKWSGATPALRGLVLYRLAEMMEARRAELAASLVTGGTDAKDAEREVTVAIDRVIWYAGWCDKYLALASTRNPVGGPHFNFSTPEPTGVVAILAPDEPALVGLVSLVVPALVSGNAVVAVASEIDPCTAVVFSECVATSDLPAGAFNLLTGTRAELAPGLAGHMDVNAFAAVDLEREFEVALGVAAAENVKRTHFEHVGKRKLWLGERFDDLERVLAFTELKTIWHPAKI